MFEFDDTLAKDIQVDRTSMQVFEASETVKEAIKLIEARTYSLSSDFRIQRQCSRLCYLTRFDQAIL